MALNLRGVRAEDRGYRDDYIPYEDPNVLDIPTFGDEDEFVYRWLRVEIRGEDDTNNIAYRKRQGWEFVKEENLPDGYREHYIKHPLKGNEVLDGCVRNGDLVLGKWEKRKAKGYQMFIKKKNDAMAGIFDRKRLKDETTGEDIGIVNESTSRTTRGRVPKFDQE